MTQGLFRLIIIALVILPLSACDTDSSSSPSSSPAQSRSVEQQLDQLIDRYLTDYWHQHPDRATRAGLTAWNDRLPAMTADDMSDSARQIREVLTALEAIDPAQLGSADHRVDLRLLGQHARVRLAEIEQLPRWQREPRIYLPIHAFNDLLLDTDTAIEQRAEWMLARLSQLPTLLAAGQANLDNPPQAFTLDAIRSGESQLAFFQQTLPAFAQEVPALETEIIQASTRAAEAVEDYLEFLRNELLPRSNGQIAVGRDMYEFYLREIHGLNLDADELIALGESYYAETERLLKAQAERITPGRHWAEITEDIRQAHPERDDLLNAYCREIQRSRAFVVAQGLVSVPDREEVRCIHSDPSQRAFSPFGTFRTPAPFTQSKIGYLILHPVPEGLPVEEEARLLRAHDLSWIQVIAPHEAYPGHHLQALLAQAHERPLRKVYSTPVFTEGWGLYTEELMHEHGFFDPADETRLTQLRLRLWRAARVLLDARIHTGQISVDQARHFLADHIRMEHGATAGEVNIYVYRPSYAIGYVVGYYEMMALREDWLAGQGDTAELRQFHDQLLRLGSIPFPAARELMALP
jgi:uncharacterized protein (DUF885 family)